MTPEDNRIAKMHKCIVNIGIYRSGTTTLAKAASHLGMKVYRRFPDLRPEELKKILQDPGGAVNEWACSGGVEALIDLVSKYDFVCDGWFAMLPFLSHSVLDKIDQKARDSNVELRLVATSRDIEALVKSELQHWVVQNLEHRAELPFEERSRLEENLGERARLHQQRVRNIVRMGRAVLLPLSDVGAWPDCLRASTISDISEFSWASALKEVGVCNSSGPLPIEGILLTMRLGSNDIADKKITSVERLLDSIEQDHLCRYLIVFGIDADERDTRAEFSLVEKLQCRANVSPQMVSFYIITNPTSPTDKQFAICDSWHCMAVKAWEKGADWEVLLGDDVTIDCSYHYRAFFRSFLDIADRLKLPRDTFFGSPFWNDTSFPGFPSFPCMGKSHFEIFRGLIPNHRNGIFVNQDLDPYLHNLYLKLDASPCVTPAKLVNGIGGNIGAGLPRYKRVPAKGWQDFVLEDFRKFVRPFVPEEVQEDILLDVVVPSYRVRLDYLQSICYLRVPERIHTNFIIIVDNQKELFRAAKEIKPDAEEDSVAHAVKLLENRLGRSGNTVRVRCNEENVGASASRNRGLDESCAEFVSNLDDDLTPDPDLLEHYGKKILEIDDSVVGLVGLVRFPRSPNLPLRHAAVLMSYLTFMFEIAEQTSYATPAWGVTANVLFRRTGSIRFDLAYAKTGGGEDVDYALRITEACGGGKLLALPKARVVHPFWPGSIFGLLSHFHNWAIGDGSLFSRFPEHCYWSFPNLPEMLLVVAVPFCLQIGVVDFFRFFVLCFSADVLVDGFSGDWNHRIGVVQGIGSDRIATKRSVVFYLLAHILANLYVFGLECGRLRGHISRMDLFHGLFRRFDWHIGRLERAPTNFRWREAQKLILFVAILSGFCTEG